MPVNYTFVFLIVLTLWILSLAVPERKRPRLLRVLPYLSLVAGGLQLWFSGFYWFLLPAYTLTAVLATGLILKRIRDPQGMSQSFWVVRLISLSGALLMGLSAVAVAWLFPLEYPEFTGPWKPAYAQFHQGEQQFGVYYPVKPESALLEGLPPSRVYPWENHLEDFNTGISLKGTGAPGNWSLVVLHGPEEEVTRNQHLWAELASWGLVCVFSAAGVQEAPKPEILEEWGRKIFSRLNLGYSGQKGIISWSADPGSTWAARIFWNPAQTVNDPSDRDLFLSGGTVPSGVYTALWTPTSLPWNEDGLVRPWLRLLGQLPLDAHVQGREREYVIREFLLWKMRQGEGRLFVSPQAGPWNFRLVSP